MKHYLMMKIRLNCSYSTTSQFIAIKSLVTKFQYHPKKKIQKKKEKKVKIWPIVCKKNTQEVWWNHILTQEKLNIWMKIKIQNLSKLDEFLRTYRRLGYRLVISPLFGNTLWTLGRYPPFITQAIEHATYQ